MNLCLDFLFWSGDDLSKTGNKLSKYGDKLTVCLFYNEDIKKEKSVIQKII